MILCVLILTDAGFFLDIFPRSVLQLLPLHPRDLPRTADPHTAGLRTCIRLMYPECPLLG